MNKRHIVLLFLFVAFLGCFFQYARLDGFLHLGAVQNSSTASTPEKEEDAAEHVCTAQCGKDA